MVQRNLKRSGLGHSGGASSGGGWEVERCVHRLDERVKPSLGMVGSPQNGTPVRVARTLILLREV